MSESKQYREPRSSTSESRTARAPGSGIAPEVSFLPTLILVHPVED